MATFREAYTDYYDNGLRYELITEVAPKVWKIFRKDDRMEYLAQDITDTLFTNPGGNSQQLSPHGQLLAPGGENLFEQVKKVLNHPNLVSLVDCFALQFSDSGKLGRDRWFTVWDYCDAGNIGNLLVPAVPAVPRPQDPPPSIKSESEDGDIKMEDIDLEDATPQKRNHKFLPESFCWHVLTSVLRALMWLHDGVRELKEIQPGEVYERVHEDPDWQPMLHRNIHPQNIFVGYPRRREWYGPVKLGNYGQLVISGHCQTPGEKHVPMFSKVIGPPPNQKYASLEDLIAYDAAIGGLYPHQRNQPYTILSEYRALGEIMQAMMVEPKGNKHMRRIQSQTARVNLQNLDYSGRLRNLIIKMMEFDPWDVPLEQPNPTYVTSGLYYEALQGVQWFMRSGSDEVDSYVTSHMAEIEDYIENTELRATRLFDSFENVEEILEQFADSTGHEHT